MADSAHDRDKVSPTYPSSHDEEPVTVSVAAVGLERLGARRWLIAIAGAVLILLSLASGLTWPWALAGFLAFSAAAALLPREETVAQPGALAGKLAALARRDTERLSQIMEAVPDPAILLAPDGGIVSFNARAGHQYRSLRRGGNISSVVRNPDFLDAVTDVTHTAEPITVSYLERVPIERRIDATLAALPLAEDEPERARLVMACLRDLSAQERTNRMRQDFIANASHELRTPLAALIGFIETLQGPARKDAKSQKRFLDIMAKQANRMTRLIDDLLSLSRVEMKEHLAPDEIVDVNQTVRHVIDMLEPLARKGKLKLRLQGDTAPARLRGDRDELVQLFQNLIQNAIKYGADGEAVTVTVERLEGGTSDRPRITVAVADQGAGIAPEHLPRLTERFYRIDAATSRDKGGTGLGLAIVKHIVNRHGGEMQIASEPGQGSIFKVTLPLALDQVGSEPAGRAPVDTDTAA